MALVKRKYVQEEENCYLNDRVKGIELISKIISSQGCNHSEQNRNANYQKAIRLIETRLPSFAGRSGAKNMHELQARLYGISDRLSVPGKYALLRDRSVVGIGGMFSAGKSCFLNSLATDQFGLPKNKIHALPEEQEPSTAVPTYILSGSADRVCAVNAKGAEIDLDDAALEAVSHRFRNSYHLNLAQFLSYIYVQYVGFPYQNLALLDTPGYNKTDARESDAFTDRMKAYDQLRAIDYLIWVVDVKNGTLQQSDIQFIRSLGLTTKPLLVVNKCDLRPEEESKAVVDRIQQDAKMAGLEIFSAIRYSSRYPKDFEEGCRGVQNFFAYAAKRESHIEDLRPQLMSACNEIREAYIANETEIKRRRNQIGSVIVEADDPRELGAFVWLYGDLNTRLRSIRRDVQTLNTVCEDIREAMDGKSSNEQSKYSD